MTIISFSSFEKQMKIKCFIYPSLAGNWKCKVLYIAEIKFSNG